MGKSGEFDIDFSKMLIDNDTELIDNANKIRPDISRETYLELIKKAGYISDVKEELKRIENENASIFSVIEPTELVEGEMNG